MQVHWIPPKSFRIKDIVTVVMIRFTSFGDVQFRIGQGLSPVLQFRPEDQHRPFKVEVELGQAEVVVVRVEELVVPIVLRAVVGVQFRLVEVEKLSVMNFRG